MKATGWELSAQTEVVDPNSVRLPSVAFVDFLREHHTTIHFFGLGFVQVKMDDDSRYHFYHPSLPAFTENPHNHRYHFTSTVLRGGLRNHIWKVVVHSTEGDVPAVIRYESCDPKIMAPRGDSPPVRALKVSTFDTFAGSSYYMDENTFHQVERLGSGPCVTHLVRGPKVDPLARVVCLEGKDDICPFSRNLSDDDLWTIVRESIL
jgi:hypothetical protein